MPFTPANVPGNAPEPVPSSGDVPLKLSESRFEHLIAEVEDYAILLLDVDGIIVSWNKGAEKIKGYKAHEITGKSHRLFYTAHDNAQGLPGKLLQEAHQQGRASHEGWRVKKGGDTFWGSVVLTALHDQQGNVTGYLKVTRDLTTRKMAEDRLSEVAEELKRKNEELLHSEERYHKMIAEVQDYAILLLNREGAIQNWNAGAAFIKGYQAAEIIGKSFKTFYTDDDIRAGVPDALLHEAEVRGKVAREGWRKRKDGSLFWGSVVITALHNDAGNIMGFSKVTRDLTEKKLAEDTLRSNAQELSLKNTELARLNAELSSFAYVVSHDLKEPIRKIQIFAGRLQEEDATREQLQGYAEKIISSAARMQRLMDAVLSYSYMSGESVSFEKVDLNIMLESAKSDLEISIAEYGARIESQPLPVLDGISFQMHQLFLNLLSNSLKFSRVGIPPVVTITCSAISSQDLPEPTDAPGVPFYCITIQDNGMGFEQHQAERIFDVFQRLNPKSDSKGTGIGLAIVKRIIQNHHGIITAEGTPGAGALFRIFLPATQKK